MCLVAIAWRAHPDYPLIVAGNRDEFHERPTAPAAWWEDLPHVLGGRDLVAGGSWLALSRAGRFAVVINDPRRPPAPQRTASRGALVRDYVAGDRASGRFLDGVAVNEHRYAGFSLLLGTPVQVRGFVTSRNGAPHRWTLKPGVTVLSNSPLDEPSPKVGFLQETLDALLVGSVLERKSIFASLGRREPVPADDTVTTIGRTPFIVGERYGTRASTLLTVDAAGTCDFEERRFGPSGTPSGTTRETFALER